MACGALLLLAGVSLGAALCRTRNIPRPRPLSQALSWATDAVASVRNDLDPPGAGCCFGILSVYGRQGWLASLWQSLGLEWTFSPYGLQGILLAHVFFNLPMASRLLLQALENIPGEQRQLAAQLGMRGWHFFRFVEWPWLRRQIPPVAALIFMLCFASFATVLSLGGGPQATTIELAIYQALSYDYDPARAAMLALIQMVCCLGLVLLSQRLSKAIAPGTTLLQGWRDPTIVCIAAFATRR